MNSDTDHDVLAPLRREISAPELGRLLGLTGRRVLQLADEAVLERGPGGGFEQVASIQSYIRFVRDGRGSELEAMVARAVRAALAEAGK